VKRTLLLVVGLALVLAACVPPKPQPSPPTTPQGFDTCAAPPTTTMQSWWTSSPYTSIGVYIGGANRGCAQPNLTAPWVSTVIAQGWKLLPIWVGPQAPCTPLGSTTKLPLGAAAANAQGVTEGFAAANRAASLGLAWLAPVYYDMEAYPKVAACTMAVQAFTDGWTYALNSRGYLAGYYSSLCSGIADQAAVVGAALHKLNAVWIAAWNSTPNIYGFNTPGCSLWDGWWTNHSRVHQFRGGHLEMWGGVKINMDSNAVDGPTYPW
jgi:hypothetical protein